jgi:hypothetical protein
MACAGLGPAEESPRVDRGAHLLALAAGSAIALALGAAAALGTSSPALPGLVLGIHDLSPGFEIVRAATGSRATDAAAARGSTFSPAQYRAWGYEDGYQREFQQTRSAVAALTGPAFVDSSVDVYRTAAGAAKSLNATRAACDRASSRTLRLDARIGDAAVLCEETHASAGHVVVVIGLLWRRNRFKASVEVAGVEGAVDPTFVVSLARIEDQRIAASA